MCKFDYFTLLLSSNKLESDCTLGTITNGIKTVWGIRAALASSNWPPEKLRAHQFRLLSSLLHHAYSHVPFYRSHFDRHGFHLDYFRSLEDLARIPVLDKHLLQTRSPIEFLSSGINPDKWTRISTSGSTGKPLSILLHENGQRAQRIAAWRILFECGFRWTDLTLEIRMTSGPVYPVRRFGIAPKLRLSIRDTPDPLGPQFIDNSATGPGRRCQHSARTR